MSFEKREYTHSDIGIGKNKKFNNPLEEDLVRTGTVPEGSCFFHSIYTSRNETYRKYNEKQKEKFVKRIREQIASEITLDSWKDLEMISLQPFLEKLLPFLRAIYKSIENFQEPGKNSCNLTLSEEEFKIFKELDVSTFWLKGNPVKNFNKEINNIICDAAKTYYKQLLQILSYNQFDGILCQLFQSCNPGIGIKITFDECVQHFIDGFNQLFSAELLDSNIDDTIKASYLILLSDILQKTLEFIEIQTFNNFKKTLSNCTEWISETYVKLMANKFNINIFIINMNTGLPYRGLNYDYNKKKKTILIGWIDESHFESISRKEKNKKGQVRLIREFNFKDPLIQKIYTFLYEPEKLEALLLKQGGGSISEDDEYLLQNTDAETIALSDALKASKKESDEEESDDEESDEEESDDEESE